MTRQANTAVMRARFVVMTGLPGSGKSTLAARLSPALQLPLLDKDDILARLFESKGVGDENWRRGLSRESDDIFQRSAMNSHGAILVSFWRLSGMSPESGTPTEWLCDGSHDVVQVHCACDPTIAASRFLQRRRHPGHLDERKSFTQVLESLNELARRPPLAIGFQIDVDTSKELDLTELVRCIRAGFENQQT